MTVTPDFDIHLRVIGSNGSTVRGDLNDMDAGVWLERPIGRPEGDLLVEHYTSPRSRGDFRQGAIREAAGELVVVVVVDGDSWVDAETKWDAIADDWLNAETEFFVELEEDGITRRWVTERPPFSRVSYDRINDRARYEVRFHVQPNPVVMIGG